MKVYQAICAVSLALSKEGISKGRKNQAQGYSFRGIDDVYNALAPLLAANGLCILPRVLSRECVERQSAKGGALFYVTVHVEFDLCAEDGSKHTVAMYGEAMDSGDKATNKAMSAAYKYMAMEVFAIPTEGDNDADAQTHEVVARPINPNDPGKHFWETAEQEEKNFLVDCLASIREDITNPEVAAQKFYVDLKMSMDEQGAIWSQLGSTERASIKKFKPVTKAKE